MATENLGKVKGADALINGANSINMSVDENLSMQQIGNNFQISCPGLANKQDVITGTPGQYIGFDEDGNAVAKNMGYELYGFELDDTETDPSKKITYIEQNANYARASANLTTGAFDYGDWENAFFIKDIKPVMLNYNGTIAYELNKNDYTKKTDGTASDVANDAFGGNAMIGIPTVWIKVVNVSSTRHRVYVSNVKLDAGYKAYAHTVGDGVIKPYAYIAAYNGWVDGSSRLRSISGKNPTRSQTGEVQFNEAAANNVSGDDGWTMETYSSRNLINILLLLIGKSTDTQTTFGCGNTDGYTTHAAGSDENGVLPTGTMNTRGLFYGVSTNNLGVKVFGIENWWGNVWRRVVGLFNDNGVYKVKMTRSAYDGSAVNSYNLTGNGYITSLTPVIDTSGLWAYIAVMAFSDLGILPQSSSGSSSSTHFCDGAITAMDGTLKMALLGGVCGDGVRCGAFACNLYATVADSYWTVGASPQYL